MDKKTTGIIATVATVLLCGCPGLLSLCWGLLSAFASFVPGAEIDIFGSSDPSSAMTMGIVTICVGIIFVVIPIVVGFLTLRNKPETVVPSNEPVPPAI
ncbi:MAG: hypothetical protein EHM70_11275 [Chloroflexota bacterium]|nr:MAG: hypothetical protein EHM70_11275 [Chloroflexota bacterium]